MTTLYTDSEVETIEETVDAAREFLRRGALSCSDARDFWAALVKLADSCVVGVPCARHGGAVHGQEAEELRAGVERILEDTADTAPLDAEDLRLRRQLLALLDRVDARDSLAFREVPDPFDEESTDSSDAVTEISATTPSTNHLRSSSMTQAATGNGSTNGNGNGNTGRQAKVPTAIDAITKITKILEPLSLTDRKRVLAFVNESNMDDKITSLPHANDKNQASASSE